MKDEHFEHYSSTSPQSIQRSSRLLELELTQSSITSTSAAVTANSESSPVLLQAYFFNNYSTLISKVSFLVRYL